jgi:deoxyribonuclease V
VKVRSLHPWKLTPAEAAGTQARLARLVVKRGAPGDVRTVAGCDVSFPERDVARAAVVVLTWPGLVPVEGVVVEAPVPFPYVPGLLSFREGPVLTQAFRRLSTPPDLVVFDGQGLAHPRRLGLACHMGLVLDLPAIGCAKSLLTGKVEGLRPERGAHAPITDSEGRRLGSALRTRAGVRPVYVSVGHRIGLVSARAWVLRLAPRYRLPETTRWAHRAAADPGILPAGIRGVPFGGRAQRR